MPKGHCKRVPKHEVTDERRKKVRNLAAVGVQHKEIARIIGTSDVTLRKYYRDELDLSMIEANATVAGRLYQQCMEGNTTAIIFWLKTRAQWSERHEIEHSGEIDIKKIEIEIVHPKNEGR